MMRWRGALQRRRAEKIAQRVLKNAAAIPVKRHPAWDDPEWMQARQRAYTILFRREWGKVNDALTLHQRVVKILNQLERKMGYPV